MVYDIYLLNFYGMGSQLCSRTPPLEKILESRPVWVQEVKTGQNVRCI
jgi:hypothetical protein